MTTETTQSSPSSGTTQSTAAPAGTTPSATEFSSFLGVEASELPSLRPVQNPEPTGTETTASEDQSSSESTAADEGGEELALDAETAALDDTQSDQQTSEETDDNWLPQEQAKEFPEATLKEYAQRRGYKWDPQDESHLRLLRDKLNTDIYVEQLRQDLGGNQEFEETTADEAQESQSDTAVSTTAADPRAQHYAQVDAVVKQIDQKATEELGRNFLGAMGVNADPAHLQQLQAALRNPQTTPEQRAEIQQHLDLVQNAGKIGSTLTRGAIDLFTTVLPLVLPQVLEAVAPGLLPAYTAYQQLEEGKKVASTAWEEVRTSTDGRGQPLYANLPVYGSPEFKTLVGGAERKLGLPDGALGQMFQKGLAREAYVLAAKVASGQRVAPAAVQRAVSAGRQQERIQQTRRTQGRAMGAGATSQQFTQEPEVDPGRQALRDAIREQNNIADPFREAVTRA